MEGAEYKDFLDMIKEGDALGISGILSNFLENNGVNIKNEMNARVYMRAEKDKVYVSFDLPGVKKEDITFNFDKDVLTLRGNRRLPFDHLETNDQVRVRNEISHGNFVKQVKLPFYVNNRDNVTDYCLSNGTLMMCISNFNPQAENMSFKF